MGPSINYVNKIGGGGSKKFDSCWQGGGVQQKLTSTIKFVNNSVFGQKKKGPQTFL